MVPETWAHSRFIHLTRLLAWQGVIELQTVRSAFFRLSLCTIHPILPNPCCSQNDVKLLKRCSPHAADTHSATQEIPYLLRNPKVDFGFHKQSPGFPILSHFCI